MSNTVVGNILGHYDYREELAVWFRQIFYLQPTLATVDAPDVQLHAIVAFLLFAIWPFTRLVHVFSAPVGYLWRPYVVTAHGRRPQFGNRPYRRGWIREDVGDVSRIGARVGRRDAAPRLSAQDSPPRSGCPRLLRDGHGHGHRGDRGGPARMAHPV